jgi:gliding motility-associated-like protein
MVEPIVRFLIIVYLTCCFITTILTAQPLLIDGSFEQFSTNGCNDPDKAFDQLAHWYRLDASPDVFSDNCLYDENGSFFWDTQWKAAAGERFVGLSSRWNSNGTYVSEGIGTKLTTPLVAGRTYLLKLAVRNRGGYQGFDEQTSFCNLRPDKHLAIYLSKDSIVVENNFSNGTSSTAARLAATLSNETIQSRTADRNWTIISGCFQAEGGEQFLAISMPLGTFGELPPCAAQANSGVFRSFYFHLDDLLLEDVPQQWERTLNFCEREEMWVNLKDLFKDTFLENAEFEWADGFYGAERLVAQAGEYMINGIVDCGIFQIVLTIEQSSCVPQLYAPTIFSPNGDGVNDLFQLSFSQVENVLDYRLQIFSRWGQLVFESYLVEKSWNGQFHNENLEKGLYVWKLNYSTDQGRQRQEIGQLLLVR